MGQEIKSDHFEAEDWQTFQQRLNQETALLQSTVDSGKFAESHPVGGFEIEGWLIDNNENPAPQNQAFFDLFHDDSAVTAELARFNIELNNTPHTLRDNAFSQFHTELDTTWKKVTETAHKLGDKAVLIGILPTVSINDFHLENMSSLNRYHALNEQVLHLRHEQPITLDIQGKDHLKTELNSVMLEAATTSFQVHMQVPWKVAHHYYNASILSSAALVAVSTNSPFLFGKQLWHETRIPLFEQAVSTGDDYPGQVSFGSGFAKHSIFECFEENRQKYPVLLPILFDETAEKFSHLRLHNGVIWRWNRPLIGFDDQQQPHFRIEQRVMAAGPTITDMLANAVFFYGMAESLAKKLKQGKFPNTFMEAKHNFYQTAKEGLDAEVTWEGKQTPVSKLILETLLPLAEQGIESLNLDKEQCQHYLSIIKQRTETGQTGAHWQQQFAQKYNNDWKALVRQYRHLQQRGKPVHEWGV